MLSTCNSQLMAGDWTLCITVYHFVRLNTEMIVQRKECLSEVLRILPVNDSVKDWINEALSLSSFLVILGSDKRSVTVFVSKRDIFSHLSLSSLIFSLLYRSVYTFEPRPSFFPQDNLTSCFEIQVVINVIVKLLSALQKLTSIEIIILNAICTCNKLCRLTFIHNIYN